MEITIQELEEIFRKNLREYKKDFGFVCFFGSLNLEKDLDVFIIPSRNCDKGYFIKRLISFLEKIKKEIKKKGKDLLVIWHSTYEEEVKYLNTIKDVLKLHISSFPDLQPVPIPNYISSLKKTMKVLLGNYKAIKEIKKTKLDYFYNYLFISNCLLSNYPKQLEKEKIFSKLNYIYKHLTGKEINLSGSPKRRFFECCDFLDSQLKNL